MNELEIKTRSFISDLITKYNIKGYEDFTCPKIKDIAIFLKVFELKDNN